MDGNVGRYLLYDMDMEKWLDRIYFIIFQHVL